MKPYLNIKHPKNFTFFRTSPSKTEKPNSIKGRIQQVMKERFTREPTRKVKTPKMDIPSPLPQLNIPYWTGNGNQTKKGASSPKGNIKSATWKYDKRGQNAIFFITKLLLKKIGKIQGHTKNQAHKGGPTKIMGSSYTNYILYSNYKNNEKKTHKRSIDLKGGSNPKENT